MSTASHPGPLSEIRQATQALHQKLDEGSIAKTLLSPSLSIRQYSSFLLFSREIHQAFHSELRRFWIDFEPGYPLFDRVAALNSDLQSLREFSALENPEPVAIAESSGAQWGLAYVIEGSKLGGQVLSRAIQSSLGNQGATTLFLEGHGKATGEEWKKFCVAFTSYFAQCPHELRFAKEYSAYVFERFIRTFTIGSK